MTAPVNSGTENISCETRFVRILGSVLPAGRPLALHEPQFHGQEWAYVKECLDTGWVSSAGKFVDAFENKLREITGARHAIATASGTAALHAALVVGGVKTNDEVLAPALSFVATANAVSHCGAIPHFVDCARTTMGICPIALRDYLETMTEVSCGETRNRHTGRRIAAIVPMHAFGHPADLDEIIQVSKDFNLTVIEDAAESLGSLYKSRHTGTFGKLGALSFNGNKIITTGGGGAILTDDHSIAKHAKHITTTAKISHRWEFFHDEIAWNYRLPNLNAALGCAQLEKLQEYLKNKRLLAHRYQTAFHGDPDLTFATEPPDCRSNYWLNTVILNKPSSDLRDRILAAANDAGIMVRPAWSLLNGLPMYQKCPAAPLPVAQSLSLSIINLPSSPWLVASQPS